MTDTQGIVRSLLGSPVEMITTVVVGVISIVLVVTIARYIFVPFFATFDKVYTIFSAGAEVASYILSGGNDPKATATKEVMKRAQEQFKKHFEGLG